MIHNNNCYIWYFSSIILNRENIEGGEKTSGYGKNIC